jgi:uncharacterized protein DUF4382/carboxypeptidase family protein
MSGSVVGLIECWEVFMPRKAGLLGGLLVAALGLWSCSDSPLGGLGGSGELTVQLTDAPFPFDEVSSVNVFIVRVEAKKADVTEAEAEDTTSGGWTTLATPGTAINLLELGGGKTTTLGTTTLATGLYKGFRLIIDPSQSSVTLKDGTHPDVKWPSAAQSGIKIHLAEPVDVTSAGTIMLVDFDVGRSFHMRGNSIKNNGLIFSPVVRAIPPDVSGSVSGSVRADNASGAGIAGATVEVLKAGTVLTDVNAANVVRSGVTDVSGNFTISFLAPGTYVLRATPPAASGYKPALLTGGLTITTIAATTNQVIIVTK